MPEHLGRDRLTVVHASLAGIVAEHTVDQNLFFALAEPPVFTTEAALGLSRRCRHPECGDDTDQSCNESLECEEVAPTTTAVGIVNMKKTKGQEGTDNGCGLVRNPEVT